MIFHDKIRPPRIARQRGCACSLASVVAVALVCVAALGVSGQADAAPEEGVQHVVAQGHTLGKIAKRYNVSVEDLCRVNGIDKKKPLKPGQRLVIPQKVTAQKNGQSSGDTTDVQLQPRSASASAIGSASDSSDSAASQSSYLKGPYTTHLMAPGHILGKVAQRYLTTVEDIQRANGLKPRQTIKAGTCLVIPLSQKHYKQLRPKRLPCVTAEIRAEQQLAQGASSSNAGTVGSSAEANLRAYARRPSAPGVIHLVRGGSSFRGRVVNTGGRGIPAAISKVDALLYDRRTQATHSTSVELLSKLTQVSDFFGGRRIIIVSGFREESSNRYTTRSNHALGKAIDFRIEGVPNEALRDYCHTLSGVGVGYYPNSSFVHLDVRKITTHWTDVSGPGERPRYTSMTAITQPTPSTKTKAPKSKRAKSSGGTNRPIASAP